MSVGYVINVGSHTPQKVIVATPDRRTGNPTGDVFEVYKQTGVYQLINRIRVWARRVLPDGKLPVVNGSEVVLEVNDTRYKGNIETLPWGEAKTGAQAIELRFLQQSSSLDYEYQRTIQKIETMPEDGTAFIELNPGENKFDPKLDVLKVKFLNVHPQNRDSISKNPDPRFKGFTFFEVNEKSSDRSFVTYKEKAIDAGLTIKQLSTKPEQLRNLLEVILNSGSESENPIFMNMSTLSTDTDIYRALLMYSDESPVKLVQHIDGFKQWIIDRFKYAESFNVLDLSKKGHIAVIKDGKPDIVWSDVPDKNMMEWVVGNCFDESVYTQMKKFAAFCSTLK